MHLRMDDRKAPPAERRGRDDYFVTLGPAPARVPAAEPSGARPAPRRPRAALPWLVLLGLVVLLGAAARADVGIGPPGAQLWGAASPVPEGGEGPPPRRAASRVPLGVPPPVHAASGPHAFIAQQPGGDAPVAYDPCRPLRYVVNARTAPPGGAALLDEALATISRATGLQLVPEGATTEASSIEREAHQPGRYGDRWAPILIAWTDPAELPTLQGEVAGMAGSTSLQPGPRDPRVYVTGNVALDGPQLGAVLASSGGPDAVRGVIIHELAHLVGLDHVDDPTQLLHPRGPQTALQAGDLAGLARLGSGACVRRL